MIESSKDHVGNSYMSGNYEESWWVPTVNLPLSFAAWDLIEPRRLLQYSMELEQCLDLILVFDMAGKLGLNFDFCGLVVVEVLELRKLPMLYSHLEDGMALRNIVLKDRKGLHGDDIVP